MLPQISNELREASGGLPVAHVRTIDEMLVLSTSRQRLNMWLLTVFGGSALFMAAIGLYGLMAYSVQQRTQEIGIRIALGAPSESIRNMILFRGMALVLGGVGIGLAAAFGLAHFIANLLFGGTEAMVGSCVATVAPMPSGRERAAARLVEPASIKRS
jgi:putative ABC transport system permease protein